MADAVTTNVLQNTVSTDGTYVIHLTNISDATGESAVIKIDKSVFTSYDGAEPNGITIKSVRWCMNGFTAIRLLWDHTTDDLAMVLTGSGFDDFSKFGGLRDPASTGGTGDLLLTTTGASATANYDITLEVEMK